jgi:uncharacterized protein DUF6166
MSKRYIGSRTKLGVIVEVEVRDHRNKVRKRTLRHIPYHSPEGFEMGYGGSGPADLALAILVDYFGERPPRDGHKSPRFSQWTVKSKAWKLHQSFKWKFIAGFGGQWTLYNWQIQEWLKEQEVKEKDNGTIPAVDFPQAL